MKMIGFCLKNEWNDKPAIQFLFDLNQNEINGGGSEIHSVVPLKKLDEINFRQLMQWVMAAGHSH